MSITGDLETSGPTRVTKRFNKAIEAEDRLLFELGKKYRILAQLGEGGTARVWLAMARGPSGFNKLVVLKTIRGELFDNSSVVDMFLEEARLAARLNHPHIVQTNEVFEQSQHPVIVMEYLDGLPFSAILERQREGSALALAMLLRIVSDALSGLHAAHELRDYDGTPLSVVHRDVSPHNLFVTFAGQVKVLDFGIAQFSASDDATDTGVIKGKLRYIAPEQVQGEAPVDRRADIFSMGVVLWEVATARRMWAGVTETTILKRIVSGDLPRATDTNPEVDLELERIIERALSKNPKDRFATALEFQTALDHYVGTLGGTLRNRDIGRALSKMFDDVREERRQTIEQQLARSDTLHDIHLSASPLPELTSFSNVQGVSPLRPYRFRPGPRMLVALALLAMSAFALLLLWPQFQGASRPDEPTPTATKPAPSPAPETSPPPPRSILLRITAFPRTALLSLDGALLPSNPHFDRVPFDDDSKHTLLVKADGHKSESRTLIFSSDQELVLTLAPLPNVPEETARPKPTQKAIRRPAPAPSPEPVPEAETKPNCATPYYFDDRGIKKYRPECL